MVERVHAEGGAAALVTLTARHHRGHRLAATWDAITHAWSRVASGRAYSAEWETFGITGWCAVVEATHGDAGWHPHRHVLVLFDTPVSQDMLDELAGRWFARWEKALARKGFSAVESRGGLDARLVAVGDSATLGTYLSKIAHEVTGSAGKRGRGGSRTPFEILEDGLATGLADDIELWWEFEQTAHRRRTLTWAQGTRERYGVRVETDEEIVAEELSGAQDDVLGLPAPTWKVVQHQSDSLIAAAERDGFAGATAWLTERGLEWTRVVTASKELWPAAAATARRSAEARRVLCPTS